MKAVLDSSALLAHLRDERGADIVQASLDEGASISAVNWAEVLTKAADLELDVAAVAASLRSQGLLATLTVVPFGADDGVVAAGLRMETRGAGLSLGDRACLSLGLRLSLPVLTADRAWEPIGVGVDIRQIR